MNFLSRVTGCYRVISDVTRRLTYDEAYAMHRKQWFEGKHKEWGNDESDYNFPYGSQYEDEGFVEVKIPSKDIETITGPDVAGDRTRQRVERYKNILKEKGERSMGPIWVSAGRKLRDGTISRSLDFKEPFSALDGNHRAQAAKELGHATQDAIMPASHWKAYTEGTIVRK